MDNIKLLHVFLNAISKKRSLVDFRIDNQISEVTLWDLIFHSINNGYVREGEGEFSLLPKGETILAFYDSKNEKNELIQSRLKHKIELFDIYLPSVKASFFDDRG